MTVVVSDTRLPWPDAAKGACILGVVLWHVTRKDYLQLPWDVHAPIVGAWGQLSMLLLPVRMPLFFFISGLFTVRLLDRPWPHVLARRVAPLLYVFVLWTLVQTLVLQLTPGFDTEVADGPMSLVAGLTISPGNLWYLLALAVYVVIARATRSHPHLALGAAFALAVVAALGAAGMPGNRYGLLANLVFFLLGTRTPRPGRPVVLGLAAVFVVAVTAWLSAPALQDLPGFRPALGLLGIAAGGAVTAPLARLGWLASLGRQTLPVYVLHLPLVALVHLLSPHLGGSDSLLLATLYPAAATALVVLACLGLHRVLPGWLFRAPWLARERVSKTQMDRVSTRWRARRDSNPQPSDP